MRTAKFTGKWSLLVVLVGCAVAASLGTRYAASVSSSSRETWPSNYDESPRRDMIWSLGGFPISLSVDEFLAQMRGARKVSRGNPGAEVRGALVGGEIIGFYDRENRVRGLRGVVLSAVFTLVVKEGDPPETVEAQLGHPTTAGVAPGIRFATEWRYEYESTAVEILFERGRVRTITLREKDFPCGGPDC